MIKRTEPIDGIYYVSIFHIKQLILFFHFKKGVIDIADVTVMIYNTMPNLI